MGDREGSGSELAPPRGSDPATLALVREEAARTSAELQGLAGQTDPFVSAVRATRMPMIVTNPRLPDNPVVFANNAFCRLSGYPREEIVGRNCRFLQGPETDPAVVAQIRAAVAEERSIEIDIRNRRKNGELFWNRLLLAPVRDAAGELSFFFASQVDVTLERERLAGLEVSNAALLAELGDRLRAQQEDAAALKLALEARHRVEAELLQKAAEFEALAENVSQLAWMAEPDGTIFWYNKRWYDYTGTTAEQMFGWGWRDVHRAETIEATLVEIKARWEEGVRFEGVYDLRSVSGEFRSFLTRVEPIRDEEGRLVRWFGTNTDITEQREAERRLKELNDTLEMRVAQAVADRATTEEQLRQSQKMEAVGQLTGGLAHDFNNLLTGISGSIELLQSRIAQGRLGDLERYVMAAQGAAKRAAALTHRLLAFSRRQTLEPKPTDVNRLVTGMEDMVRRTIGPGVSLEIVTGGGLWPTLVDPSQLENALLNLCINGRDAMPDGGRLTVETGNTWLDDAESRKRELPAGQYVSLSVSDNGSGMSPEVVSRAFDPFFTTKPIGEGTGLGLSMIYGFAKQSGGQVRIYSEVGQGTRVRLYLPRHLGEAETPQAMQAAVDPVAGTGAATVLVVDDEPTVRMLVTEVLGDMGYTTLEAGDARAALAVLDTPAEIDLLITDVGLPAGLNGRQLADAARVSRPGLRVLFITGYAENAVLSHGHLDPGMHVITKPFSVEALSRRVRQLLSAEE